MGSIPGLGRSPAVGNGNPLKYSCLDNPMDREPGRLPSGSHKELDMSKQMSTHILLQRRDIAVSFFLFFLSFFFFFLIVWCKLIFI